MTPESMMTSITDEELERAIRHMCTWNEADRIALALRASRASEAALKQERSEIREALGDTMSENTTTGIAKALREQVAALTKERDFLSGMVDEEIEKLVASDLKCLHAENELDRLRAFMRNQAGDNLCWLDNSGVVKIPQQAEFLESCRRYHAQVSGSVGVLDSQHMTIAQLEAELERLRAEQRIPPGMTAEKLDALASWIQATRGQMVLTNADVVLKQLADWATWVREHTEDEWTPEQLGDIAELAAEYSGPYRRLPVREQPKQQEQPDWKQKIFSHKHLDPRCVESGCRSLFGEPPGTPEGFRIKRIANNARLTIGGGTEYALCELERIAPQGK